MDSFNDKIDKLEMTLLEYPKVDCPVNHRFYPGMYVREIFMKKNTWITSLVHLTCHPFFVLQGKVSVLSENDGEQIIQSPYIGTTLVNTRRVLFIHEDTVWATCHKTDVYPKDNTKESIMEAVNLIDAEIIDQRENKMIGGIIKNNILTKAIKNET